MILILRDATGAEHSVGVSDGRFVEVDDTRGAVHDLRRLVAFGGLADSHAHLSGNSVAAMIDDDGTDILGRMLHNARLQLEGGVLLLAEKGARSSLSLRILDRNATMRPRMQMAGRMVAVAGGYYPGFAAEVDDSNLDAIIGAAVAGGARWVKVVGDWPRRGRGAISNFSEAELERIVAISHAAGCRVAIHAAAPKTPGMAVRAGVDSIEHGLYMTSGDVEALGERGGAWVPTLFAMESIAQWLGTSSSGGRVITRGLDNVAALLTEAVDAGVAVLAGTDVALPHGGVAREALKLIEYGLSPRQAIHAVTRAAYDFLGEPAGFGCGQVADAVFFAGDPTENPSVLLDPQLIIRAGRVVKGHSLLEQGSRP